MAKPAIEFVVILQTPQYGTLSWGPFPDRESAEEWVQLGGHLPELWAAYETDRPSGMCLFVNPLYSTDTLGRKKKGGE